MKLKWAILFLFCMANAHAQMYRWVDADGRVTYSDKPPPASASQQQKKTVSADDAKSDGLAYALSETVRNFPVTLYTSGDCAPCEEGRQLLRKRGIPYSEKTVGSNEDLARLKQEGGNGMVPLLKIGRNAQSGFSPDAWNAALSAVGYPETSQLPANYKFSAPAPAAPTAPAAAKPIDSPTPAVTSPPAQGNATPGFRF